MDEIKIGSIVSTGIGLKFRKLHLRFGVIGLVINLQGDNATILRLDGEHKYMSLPMEDLKVVNNAFNYRCMINDLKDCEYRRILTLKLENQGYSIDYTEIKICRVDSYHDSITYSLKGSKDPGTETIMISPIHGLEFNYQTMDQVRCII